MGGSLLVHLLVFGGAMGVVWTMPHKEIKPPFCTVNLVSMKDLGTGNSEPKGVPKGSEETKIQEARKSFTSEAQKSGPSVPIKRLHLEEEPKRNEVPIKKIEPKEAPKLEPQETASVNLDKLIPKKVVPQHSAPQAVQESKEKGKQTSSDGGEPAAARSGRTSSTDNSPRGTQSGSTDAGARGATQGSTAGSVEGSAMNALVGMYGEKVKQAIQREWRLFNDQGISGAKAVVQVQIQKNGELISVQVVKASGNNVFDEAAIRAVRKAAPLPPVPEVMAQSNIITLKLYFMPGTVS